MKTLRKLIPFIFLTASAFTTTGCSMYQSKADTLENIAGFYELEIWQGKKEASDQDTYDRKAEEGTVAYFTIDKDGYAYYGFKDNDTSAWVKPCFATYKHDDDQPELYEAVTIEGKVDTVYAWEKKVGCLDEPIMGFKRQEVVVEKKTWPFKDKTEMKSTLAYSIPWHEYTWYNPHKIQKYQYVQYKRISGDTGYQVINQKLDTNFQMTVPYEIYGLEGYWVYRCETVEGSELGSRGLYEYAVLDIGSYSNGKLNVHYSLKANPGRRVMQVPVEAYEKGKSYKVTFNGQSFIGTGMNCSTDSSTYPAESEITRESFTSWWSSDLTLDEVIEKERTPEYTAYVEHQVTGGQKEFAPMTTDYYTNEITLNGLELQANEEFSIFTNSGGIWKYFEDYVEEDTAGGKIIEGSSVGVIWTQEGEAEVHKLKATEAGSYNLRVDSNGKLHIVH